MRDGASADTAIVHPASARSVIGHAVKVDGHVTVVRNGVTILLNEGDVVLKGDVVATGHDGAASLAFTDGSAFQLGHDSSLALNRGAHEPVVLAENGEPTSPASDAPFTLAQSIAADQVNNSAPPGPPDSFDAILKLQQLAQKLFSDALDTHSGNPIGSSTPPGPADLPKPGSGDIPPPPPIPLLNFIIEEVLELGHSTLPFFINGGPLKLSGAGLLSGIEGKATGTLQLATFTDNHAVLSDFNATVTWGDGTTTKNATVVALGGGRFAVEGSHTYAEEGSYIVNVTVVDGPISVSTISLATIGDAPLSATAKAVTATEGASTGTIEVATVTDANVNAPVGDFTATINWGDGTTTRNATVVALGGGHFAVEGAHTYAEEGGYTVGVSVKDDGGSTAHSSGTASVADAPLSAAGTALNALEGISSGTQQVAAFTDANPTALTSDFTATIDWGDGTTSSGTVQALKGGGFGVFGAHTYAEEGNYTVSTSILDAGGSTAHASSAATVTDAALTAGTLTVTGGVEGATAASLTATFSDANHGAPSTDFSGTIDWGDGNSTPFTSANVSGSGGSYTISGITHLYAEEGPYAAKVTINDDGGSTTTDSATATVADAALTAGTLSVTGGVEGVTAASLTAIFTDANPGDHTADFTATIDWGDGTAPTAATGITYDSTTGKYAVAGSHTYAEQNNHYAVTVSVADGGGNSTTIGGTADIADAALTGSSVASVNATEGASAQLINATFTDANPGDHHADFSAIIDWGDSTPTSQGVVSYDSVTKTYSVAGSHTYAEEGSHSVSVAVSDDGGQTATIIGRATVADAALTAGTVTVDGGVEAITPASLTATFTDANPGASAADFSGTIDWGDGKTTDFTGADVTGSNGAFTVNATHQYPEDINGLTGGIALKPVVTIKDAGGSTVSETGTATVADAPLTAGTVTLTDSAENFTRTTLTATFTDADPSAGPGDFSGIIDWGGGLTTRFTSADVSGSNGDFTVKVTHQYTEEGSFAPTVTIDDRGGSTLSESGTATVNDAPLFADKVTVRNGVEGVLATSLSASIFDGNQHAQASDISGTINWGDGNTTAFTSADVNANGNGSFTVIGSHQYAEDGTFTQTVTFNDLGGSSVTETGSIKILDAPLTGSSAASVTGTEGASATLTNATFTDANPGDHTSDFAATINWGDGTTSSGTVSYDSTTSRYTVAGGHAYADEGSYSVSVTVAEQGGAPAATINGTATIGDAALTGSSAASVTGTEGASAALTNATFTDANPGDHHGDFTASINWGDGTSSAGTVSYSNGVYSVAGSHTYVDEGSYSVSVTVADQGGAPAATIGGTATIGDAALTAVTTTVTASTEGGLPALLAATFSDANLGATATDFSGTIAWGDGATTSFTSADITINGGLFTVNGSHQYADEGTYTATVTISDDGKSQVIQSGTAAVADAPLLGSSAAVVSGTEGTLALLTNATFTDANPGDHHGDFTATIDWGDGTPTSQGTVSYDSSKGAYSVAGSHTYADEGSHDVSVAVTDLGKQSTTITGTASIGDAPLAASGVHLTPTEGASTGSQTLAIFTDANPNATAADFTASIDWKDGSPVDTATTIADLGDGTFAVRAAHTYADEGSYAPLITINDKGGSSTTATSLVDVADADLQDALGTSLTATEGSSTGTQTVAIFTDTNASATTADFTATVNWGDGTTDGLATFHALGGGTFSVQDAHTYADEGPFTITVNIKDDGNKTATATGVATVADAALTAGTVTATTSATSTTLEVKFTDANQNAPTSDFSGTIDWGDGSTPTSFTSAAVTGSRGAFTVTSSHQYAASGNYKATVTINDVGSSSVTLTPTVVVDAPLAAGTVTVTGSEEGVTQSSLTATFSDADLSATTGDFSGYIAWGDGTYQNFTSSAVSGSNGSFTVTATYVYTKTTLLTAPGIRINDVGGSSVFETGTAPTITDAPLTGSSAASLTLGTLFGTGGNVLANATFADASPGDHFSGTALIHWGDGSTSSTSSFSYNSATGLYSVNAIHNYAQTGSYNLSIAVSDSGGSTTTITGTATGLHVIEFSGGNNSMFAVSETGVGLVVDNNASLTFFGTSFDATSGIFVGSGGFANFGSQDIPGLNDVGSLNGTPVSNFGTMQVGTTGNGNHLGTLDLTNVAITGPGSFNVVPGGFVNVSGSDAIANPVTNNGDVNVIGNLTLSGAVSGNGAWNIVSGATLKITGSVTGTGGDAFYIIRDGGTLEFAGSVAAQTNYQGSALVQFDTGGTLKIDNPATFDNVVKIDLGNPHETIDVGELNAQAGDQFSIFTTFDSIGNYQVEVLHVMDLTRNTEAHIFIREGFGSIFNFVGTADGHGGVNVHDPVAAPTTIAAGETLSVASSWDAPVTFAANTGTLQLNNPASFTGHIIGFTGTDAAHSDAIELDGVDFNSAQFAETYHAATGVLSVTDGTNSASLTLDHFQGSLNFASDKHGGVLITDTPAAQPATIAAGELLDITSADAAAIAFADGTGMLKLDDPASFTGHIARFTGTAPDAAHSDVIDLVGIDFNSAQFSGTFDAATGRLTVSDGNNSVYLTFDDFQGAFKFASDNHGGTLIFDPPAQQTPPAAPNSPAPAAFAVAGSDSFVFHPGMGAQTVSNFDLQHQTIELDHFEGLQTLQQLQAAITSDGLGEAIIALGHGDNIVLAGVTAQQLEATLNHAIHLR